jgi:outer membrane receptor protein involved in Fe transport
MNRLRTDIAVYKTTSVDQIVPVAVSYATGYEDRIYNAGDMENKGIELTLAGTPVKSSGFSWDIALNWTKNVNEVKKLYGDIVNLDLKAYTGLQGGVSINARVGEHTGNRLYLPGRGEGGAVHWILSEVSDQRRCDRVHESRLDRRPEQYPAL